MFVCGWFLHHIAGVIWASAKIPTNEQGVVSRTKLVYACRGSQESYSFLLLPVREDVVNSLYQPTCEEHITWKYVLAQMENNILLKLSRADRLKELVNSSFLKIHSIQQTGTALNHGCRKTGCRTCGLQPSGRCILGEECKFTVLCYRLEAANYHGKFINQLQFLYL